MLGVGFGQCVTWIVFQLDETNTEHEGSGEVADQHKPVRKCLEVKVWHATTTMALWFMCFAMIMSRFTWSLVMVLVSGM